MGRRAARLAGSDCREICLLAREPKISQRPADQRESANDTVPGSGFVLGMAVAHS
jgi:hypothetical protein